MSETVFDFSLTQEQIREAEKRKRLALASAIDRGAQTPTEIAEALEEAFQNGDLYEGELLELFEELDTNLLEREQ